MKKKFPSLCILLLLVFSLCGSPALRAEVIFEEDFANATDGQKWNGYNGWTGNDNQIIKTVGGTLMGHFVGSPTTSGTMTFKLDESYPLANAGYRLTFSSVGYINKPFFIGVGDEAHNYIGLHLGASNDTSYGIAAAYIPASGTKQRVLNFTGGYNDSKAPTGFSSTAIYHASIDINGTDRTLTLGGLELEPNKMRVTYNFEDTGSLGVYSIIMDIPEGFIDFSEITVWKITGTAGERSVGDLRLSAEAIPEPSTFGAMALIVLACTLLPHRRAASGRVE